MVTSITPITMVEFLKRYGYENATEEGCRLIYNTWMKNKAKLLEKFRKHPNWDEENLAIVFKEGEYERGFDSAAFEPFLKWVNEEKNKLVIREGYEDSRYKFIRDDYDKYINCVKKARFYINELASFGIKLDLMPDLDLEQVRIKKKLIDAYRDKRLTGTTAYYVNGREYFIPDELYENINYVLSTLAYIRDNCKSQFISAEQAESINERCPAISVSEGLKLTKAIQRVCKVIGLDKIKDVRQAHDNTDRMKDFGFNYQFQLLADSINPTKYKRITVISLNPLDYWGMSFGYKWASCHTIDKKNIRGVTSNHYSGCYSAGTESYMLDSSSVIFYVIREDYEGNTYWDEDKMQRVVFCVNENASMILESRVYPDGRDGGDNSLSDQFRSAMQKVISETYDLNNYWRIEKGTKPCRDNTTTTGSHYTDYLNYPDVNISFNKDECLTFPKIQIGHKTLCPGCGETHGGTDNIMCPSCIGETYVRCYHCDEEFCTEDNDDYIYSHNGHYFCDYDCAEAADYRRCSDDDEWYYCDDLYYCEDDGCYHLERYCYRDDHDDCYYTGDPYIETEDGHYFASSEHAHLDGYEEEYFSDEWLPRDDLYYDSYENVWFDADNDDAIVTTDGSCFATDSSAENSGYVETVDGDWVRLDDAIEIDGDYYADEDEANCHGYTLNEDGVWVEARVEERDEVIA